jgi:hypothetical protein
MAQRSLAGKMRGLVLPRPAVFDALVPLSLLVVCLR